jgi:hypothetical protein
MTATESPFFGTINDFCNKICHKQTIVGTREKLREPMRQKRSPGRKDLRERPGRSFIHPNLANLNAMGLLSFALERMAYSHQNI